MMNNRFLRISLANESKGITIRKDSKAYDIVSDVIPFSILKGNDELFSAFGKMVLKIQAIANDLPHSPPQINQTFTHREAQPKVVKFLEKDLLLYEGDSTSNSVFICLQVLELIKTSIVKGDGLKLEDVPNLSY